MRQCALAIGGGHAYPSSEQQARDEAKSADDAWASKASDEDDDKLPAMQEAAQLLVVAEALLCAARSGTHRHLHALVYMRPSQDHLQEMSAACRKHG